MRLRTRLDALTRRLPPALGTEAAINRAVFALHDREQAAEWAAVPPHEREAFHMECERAMRDDPDFLAHFEAGIAWAMAEHERKHGPAITVAGHGWIGERDYGRLRAAVTGETWHG